MDVVLLSAGLVALVVGAVFVTFERWSITPPILGLLVGILVGPEVLGAFTIPAADQHHVIHVASRLLLAVALMGVALRYPIEDVRARLRPVGLLLLVLMPAMAAVGALGGSLALGLPLGAALVLGTSLSPTDPVLASGIVTGEPAEEDIPTWNREVLSLESGANDGLAEPFVILAIAVALQRSMPGELGAAVAKVVGAIVLGVLFGTAAGRAIRWAEQHRDLVPSVRSLYALVLAMATLGVAGLLRVDGLLAVFAAGLAHSHSVSSSDREHEVTIDETMNQFLVIPVFLLFGVVLPWSDWATLGWGAAAFVAIVLVLRRLPWTVLVRRLLGATRPQVVWLGWFGPMGVAALYSLTYAHAQGMTDATVWAAGTLAVAVSTVVHGLTAAPARIAYARLPTSDQTADPDDAPTRRDA